MRKQIVLPRTRTVFKAFVM